MYVCYICCTTVGNCSSTSPQGYRCRQNAYGLVLQMHFSLCYNKIQLLFKALKDTMSF